MATVNRLFAYEGIPIWRHARIIEWTLQVVSGVVIVALLLWFFSNIGNAVEDRDIPFGFTFLDREYQTPIGEHFIPYDSSDTFGYAMFVAITNTLLVAVLGVILATALGIAVGVARLSNNWIVSKIALVYIEFFRNVPLLVQLLFWLFIILALPPVREGFVIADLLYINNAGVSFPGPNAGGDFGITLLWVGFIVLGVVLGVLAHARLSRRELETGRASYPVVAGFAIAVGVAAVSWGVLALMGDAPITFSAPEPRGRFGRIGGGVTIRAGLLVLLIGLVIYTASFIAEIVRAGIQSVGRGQVEAARATGLSPMQALRHVTFPQALRVIIPPLISQYLNLTKNSSLGGAVGYTDLTNVGITMTQTAPAVSIFLLIMLAYLAMSLTWSLIGNIYNRRISFERDEAQSGGVLAMAARALPFRSRRRGGGDDGDGRGES